MQTQPECGGSLYSASPVPAWWGDLCSAQGTFPGRRPDQPGVWWLMSCVQWLRCLAGTRKEWHGNTSDSLGRRPVDDRDRENGCEGFTSHLSVPQRVPSGVGDFNDQADTMTSSFPGLSVISQWTHKCIGLAGRNGVYHGLKKTGLPLAKGSMAMASTRICTNKALLSREISQFPCGRLMTWDSFPQGMGTVLVLVNDVHFFRILFCFSACKASAKSAVCGFMDYLILHHGTPHSTTSDPGGECWALFILKLR